MLLLVSSAWAISNFPPMLEESLGMPCQPQCTVCHETNVGGSGTVTQPFGIAMMGAGLLTSDLTSLDAAVAELEAAGTDSDGDGEPDVAELTAGTDPNVADAAMCEGAVEAPTYGCLSVTGGAGAAGGVLLAVGAMVAARRR
jgi:hypothetical protein